MLAVGWGEEILCSFKHSPAITSSLGLCYNPSTIHLVILNSSDLGRLIYSPLPCLSPPDSTATRQNLPAAEAACSRLSIIPSVELLLCSLTNKKYTQKPTTSQPCRHTPRFTGTFKHCCESQWNKYTQSGKLLLEPRILLKTKQQLQNTRQRSRHCHR